MSSTRTYQFGPVCGVLSCTDDAIAVVDHPDHGRRTVCEEHAADYTVVDDV